LGSYFELNTMMPLIAHNLLSGVELLANASRLFAERCVQGIEVNKGQIEEMVARNLALATALAPVVGYDRAAEIAKEAYRSGRTVREVALAWDILPAKELDVVLDPRMMTGEIEDENDKNLEFPRN
jgi:fumarate hydratase class II